jgi:hypothetical protein
VEGSLRLSSRFAETETKAKGLEHVVLYIDLNPISQPIPLSQRNLLVFFKYKFPPHPLVRQYQPDGFKPGVQSSGKCILMVLVIAEISSRLVEILNLKKTL